MTSEELESLVNDIEREVHSAGYSISRSDLRALLLNEYDVGKTRNDGGPAFPGSQTTDFDVTCEHCKHIVRFHDIMHPGMSLRDYFARGVMEGIYASMPYKEYLTDRFITPEDMQRCAEVAFAQAEFMLKAREQKRCACSET